MASSLASAVGRIAWAPVFEEILHYLAHLALPAALALWQMECPEGEHATVENDEQKSIKPDDGTNQALRDDNTRLHDKNQALQFDNISLLDANQAFQVEITSLHDANQALQVDNTSLRDANQALQVDITNLRNANQALQVDFTNLRNANQALGDDITSLRDENQVMRDDNQVLRDNMTSLHVLVMEMRTRMETAAPANPAPADPEVF
ncbi:hypothetical protein BGZ95_010998 [Linnemannia exigua]|uniref:Uncharacterized protein n=1 Tax=Linnemannia exigua TaxID=604196 RepID=A0AAD4H5Y8_9FUNG|nr:hypothetical protein BGZ95_010998 [Linnemannia exigua]